MAKQTKKVVKKKMKTKNNLQMLRN